MDNVKLQQMVEYISLTVFEKKFLHRATFNSRLRTTGGRYLLTTHNIEINRRYLDEFGMKELEGIIKHELCHYHLHLENKGYRHGDRDFKELLRKTDSPRFCSHLMSGQQKKPTKIVKYKCSKCGLEYRRKRRINTDKYRCGACNGKIKLINELTSI